jgi:drug/metabolite transporter (DMT)-like permease
MMTRVSFGAGLALTAAYVLVGSAGEVYAAAAFQHGDTYSTLLIAFVITTVAFNIPPRVPLRATTDSTLRGLLALNAATAVAWLGLFIGLRYAEPAIVVSFIVAIGPISTIWVNRLVRGGSASPSDVAASVLILLVGAYLVWVSVSGNAAMDWNAGTAFGIAASIAAGVALTTASVFVKRLFELRLDARAILANRFYGAIAVLLILVDHGILLDVLRTQLASATLIAFGTIIIPILLLQAGIRVLEPLVVNMVLSTSPLVTFAMQYLDVRLTPSPYTLVGNFLIVVIALWSVVSHARRVKR